MEFTADQRRWAKNRQRMYGRTQVNYLDMIKRQSGRCAFSDVPLRFEAVSGTPIAGPSACILLKLIGDTRGIHNELKR
jgi:hypothetical protein